MKRVVRTRRDVRFTVTIALKILSKDFHPETQLKEEALEEVGGVDDGEDEDGGKVDGEDGVEEPPLEHHRHLKTRVCVAGILVGERPETILKD